MANRLWEESSSKGLSSQSPKRCKNYKMLSVTKDCVAQWQTLEIQRGGYSVLDVEQNKGICHFPAISPLWVLNQHCHKKREKHHVSF